MTVRRIALLGAESTGKSTLAAQLAKAMDGDVVPEVLRGWCAAKGRTPRQSEQAEIFELQKIEEAKICAAGHLRARIIVCDTTPLTVAIHSQIYFDDDSLLQAGLAHQRTYAMTLLCETDLPWVADGIQRDGPIMQARAQARIRATLDTHAIAYTIVAGNGAIRTACALAAVQWQTES